MMADDNEKPLESDKASKEPGEAGEAGDGEKAETPTDVNDLTPEEQMARFEEELKNSDWGHQPC